MTTESDGTAAPGCGDPARELLDFYINGSLEGDEEAAVRAHLETCAACAAELGELSLLAAAVAGHGTSADAPWSGRRPAMWWAGVAAALLVAVGATLYMTQQGPSGRRASPTGGPAQVLIDLGTGVLRDSGSPPVATLAPGVETIRLTFFPPVQSGGRYFVSVRRSGGEVILPEALLPGLDSMGRAALVLPAIGLAAGSCEIVLRVESAEGESRIYTYPFEIERAGPHP
jgi:putative zinc finger protein